ncbi:hypothetical protein Voc01_092130 [Virgisporangium ochraceum]|uniref:Uncharacterized protein n=1 Tax=Virgisporangium ochraceum TaxID=65505 RepID=A0A8J4A374_9ACTN|nr:hypothetical protein Voc01_092130 [Virgisporangium ochraceum]
MGRTALAAPPLASAAPPPALPRACAVRAWRGPGRDPRDLGHFCIEFDARVSKIAKGWRGAAGGGGAVWRGAAGGGGAKGKARGAMSAGGAMSVGGAMSAGGAR